MYHTYVYTWPSLAFIITYMNYVTAYNPLELGVPSGVRLLSKFPPTIAQQQPIYPTAVCSDVILIDQINQDEI